MIMCTKDLRYTKIAVYLCTKLGITSTEERLRMFENIYIAELYSSSNC